VPVVIVGGISLLLLLSTYEVISLSTAVLTGIGLAIAVGFFSDKGGNC
jgi:hypothetical protein